MSIRTDNPPTAQQASNSRRKGVLVGVVCLAGMAGIAAGTNKWLVGLSALITIPLMVILMVKVWRTPYKTGLFPVMLLPLVSMSAITVLKLSRTAPADELLSYLSRLASGTTEVHLEKVACTDRITMAADQKPQALWTSTARGFDDGALLNVIAREDPQGSNSVAFFHWDIKSKVLALLLCDMSSTPSSWEALAANGASLRIYGPDYSPIAVVTFHPVPGTNTGRDSSSVTYYRIWDEEQYEYTEPIAKPTWLRHDCLIENSSAFDAWLTDLAYRRMAIYPMKFSHWQPGTDAVTQQFLAASRSLKSARPQP